MSDKLSSKTEKSINDTSTHRNIDLLQIKRPVNPPSKLTDSTQLAFPEGRSTDDIRSEIQEKLKLLLKPANALAASGSVSAAANLLPHDPLESAQEETVPKSSKEDEESVVEQKEGSKSKEESFQQPCSDVSEDASTPAESTTSSVDTERASEKITTTIQNGGKQTTTKLSKEDPHPTSTEQETRKISWADDSDDELAEDAEQNDTVECQESETESDLDVEESQSHIADAQSPTVEKNNMHDTFHDDETTLSTTVTSDLAIPPSEENLEPCEEENLNPDHSVSSADGSENLLEHEEREICYEEGESPENPRGDENFDSEEEDDQSDVDVPLKETERSKVASMDLWSASEIRKHAAERNAAIQQIGQTKVNVVAPKDLSSAALKGPSGINIISIISLAPHSTHVDFTVETNNIQVICDQRVAPVAKFLLDQLIISEKVLKDQKIFATLEASHIRVHTGHIMVQLGRQFAETGDYGFQFQRCWKNKLPFSAYRLSLEKAPTMIDANPQPIVSSHPHKRGDFHAPTEYAYLRNHLFETCVNGVRMMRLTSYTICSVKLVFELVDAVFITTAPFGKMPTMKSVQRNPALRNCDGLRIGHKEHAKVKFTEVDAETLGSIINSLPRKDSSTSLELTCQLFHPKHGTVQLLFDILPPTATLKSNHSQLHLSQVIRTCYTTRDIVVLCNAHPPITTPTTQKKFPADYRWKVQIDVGVPAEVFQDISTYVQSWTWSPEEGILTDRILPESGWIFKHVPKFPSLTVSRRTTHILPESQGLVSSNPQNGTVIVTRHTTYYPPPPAFVYLYETNRLAHPSTFHLREYRPVTSTTVGGTCLHWDKDRDTKEAVCDPVLWKQEIQRAEEILETLVTL